MADSPQNPSPVNAGPESAVAKHFNPYSELTTTSTALTGVSGFSSSRSLNVVFLEVRPFGIFAGVKTALEVASDLALELKVPLRIVLIQALGADDEALRRAQEIQEHVVEHAFVDPRIELSVVTPNDLSETDFGKNDYWLATHWSTAHALDIACRSEVIDRSRCAYLIQDYEPGFNTWSTEFTLARSTYHAGFVPIINSAPLANFLSTNEGVMIDDNAVFAPLFDLDELRSIAGNRVSADRIRVFFYGRPSKPRNLYSLGVAALRVASVILEKRGIDAEFVTAGEAGEDIPLSATSVVTNLGALSRSEYFDLLSRIDVGLTLQYSPHPSHPPFDLAISGARAVTNHFDGRVVLHPRIAVAPADPDALASALVEAILETLDERRNQHEPAPSSALNLGNPMNDVIRTVARSLQERGSESPSGRDCVR